MQTLLVIGVVVVLCLIGGFFLFGKALIQRVEAIYFSFLSPNWFTYHELEEKNMGGILGRLALVGCLGTKGLEVESESGFTQIPEDTSNTKDELHKIILFNKAELTDLRFRFIRKYNGRRKIKRKFGFNSLVPEFGGLVTQ